MSTKRTTGWARLPDGRQIRYEDYLRSPEWAERRIKWMKSRLPKLCAACDEPWRAGMHLHHRTYKRLGNERCDDLIPLCGRCHEAVHALIPSTGYSSVQALALIRQERGMAPRHFTAHSPRSVSVVDAE